MMPHSTGASNAPNKSRSDTKKSVNESVKSAGGSLVPARNGGQIRHGSAPGNTGGIGRPASAIREKLRGSFDERIAILESIADDKKAHPSDRVKSIDLMGKYGIGPLSEVSVETVRERVGRTLEVIKNALPPDEAERLINLLEPVWS